MTENQQEPKIVVDEDWKSKVEAEKQAAAAAKQDPPQAASEKRPDHDTGGRLPPASFPLLVSTLVAQVMTAMGKAPDPLAGHAVVRPDVAKHCIDTLAMLEEKTKGNLTSDESARLSEVLHQLRMLFVTIRGQQTPPGKDK
jgi:hypothetical protein